MRATGHPLDDALALLCNTGHYAKSIAGLGDKSKAVKKRVNDARVFRNGRSIFAVCPLLEIVRDSSEDVYLRRVACETLGWYGQSVCRERIIGELSEILESGEESPQQVKAEIEKTIKRLKWL